MNKTPLKTNDKLSDRENYILSQLELNTTESIELENELFEQLNILSKEKNISFDELVNIILVESVMDIEKARLRNQENTKDEVIDMYDFYKIEELIESNKKYIVATLKQPVVLLPIKDYEKLKDTIGSF